MSLRSVFLRRLVNRSTTTSFSSINEATKHAVVMQRQVPHIQTSRKTVEVLPAQFVGTVADVPLIRMINHVTRHAEFPPYQHIDEALLFPPINQGTKHAEFPRTAATQ